MGRQEFAYNMQKENKASRIQKISKSHQIELVS